MNCETWEKYRSMTDQMIAHHHQQPPSYHIIGAFAYSSTILPMPPPIANPCTIDMNLFHILSADMTHYPTAATVAAAVTAVKIPNGGIPYGELIHIEFFHLSVAFFF